VSYTDAMQSAAAGHAQTLARLDDMARAADLHTGLLVACIVLSVALLLAVAALALLAWSWSRHALADHEALLRIAQQPTPEHQRMSHAISDIDDAARVIGEVRDELRGLRTLAETWMAAQGLETVTVGGTGPRPR